jgi:hypothetical protein
MNERIKLLAEQANELDYETFDEYNHKTVKHYKFNKEKFAQLVVRECADILMKPEYVMNHPEELTDYNRGWVNGRLLGIEHIKEHFGVEE